MVFSNNSEYDDTEAIPLEGAFYSTISYEKLFFSHFREEDEKLLTSVPEKDEAVENFILTDNNLSSIKYSPEYVTNSSPVSPTNRIITSLFSFERILTFLKYAIAYVERTDENGITHLEKHLMRYPQFFATKAIENKLNAGVKNGIIWHTQGSGKTALAYYNVRYLTDYYQKHGTIAKFYFIVDRLDLLTQAANEFRARGLHVEEINSKEDFIKNIHSTGTVNNTGKPTITVVNIQKFSKESIAKQSDYAVNVQRIYFLDEAHRSYKPTGSFLANLLSSDREAVMIALTGTPLIGTIYDDDGKPIAGKKYDSKSVFGNYIHKYYYNRSIADGYTLKLIREGIEIRHIAQGRNVPMFKTNIQTVPAGPFSGPMVCSMRPMTPENAQKAYNITVKMPNVHGAPVQMGDPEKVGVKDVMKPDYGEAVDIYEGEIPVFWPCGVTPQAAIENAKLPIVITHAPGHMFITDIPNAELNDYLEARKHKK